MITSETHYTIKWILYRRKKDYSTNKQNLDTKCTLLLNNLIFSYLVRSMCAGKEYCNTQQDVQNTVQNKLPLALKLN